jgi:hypothetical protein
MAECIDKESFDTQTAGEVVGKPVIREAYFSMMSGKFWAFSHCRKSSRVRVAVAGASWDSKALY